MKPIQKTLTQLMMPLCSDTFLKYNDIITMEKTKKIIVTITIHFYGNIIKISTPPLAVNQNPTVLLKNIRYKMNCHYDILIGRCWFLNLHSAEFELDTIHFDYLRKDRFFTIKPRSNKN